MNELQLKLPGLLQPLLVHTSHADIVRRALPAIGLIVQPCDGEPTIIDCVCDLAADSSVFSSPPNGTGAVSVIRHGVGHRLLGVQGHVDVVPDSARLQIHMCGRQAGGLVQLLQVALSRILAWHGLLSVHGAAIEIQGLRLLVLGSRGAGKSTFSGMLVGAGGRWVSDDLVYVSPGEHGVEVWPLRRDVLLRAGALTLLPETLKTELIKVGSATSEPRWLLRREACPDFFQPSLQDVDAVLVLSGEHPARSELLPMSPHLAYAHWVREVSALFLGRDYPREAARGGEALRILTDTLPTFALRAGTDLAQSAGITLLLDQLRSLRRSLSE